MASSAADAAAAALHARVCAAPGCGAPATTRCPTCHKLGVPAEHSHFCTDACFKAAWAEHKLRHREQESMNSSRWRSGFAGYSFAGTLRPAPVSEQRVMPPGVARPDYADDGVPHSELRERGSVAVPIVDAAEDIANMRIAGAIAREITDLAAAALRPGVTGDEIDALVHAACIERGVYPSPLNYHRFPKSVCVSVNEVICHGIPDARPLVDGDIVNLDVTIFYKGFHSDMNETYCVGAVDETGRRLVKVAYECLAVAVAMCRPGTMYRDLGDAITRVADAAGFTVVKNYTGHGVGRLFHTAPNVPHYAKNKAKGFMAKGHVFTIEPVRGGGGCANARARARSHSLTRPRAHTHALARPHAYVLPFLPLFRPLDDQ
jgi:methionyl aminopeptidase